jgi:quercetin dioxygenase-like cupin family protein
MKSSTDNEQEAAMATPVIRQAGEGEQRWFYGGGVHTWKVRAEESGGAFFVFEDVMTQGKMTPWHCHPDSDELAYVLEGEIEVNIDGRIERVGAGGMTMTPRGVSHAFRVISPMARMLALQTPGSAEAFYYGASEPATDVDGAVDFERIKEMAKSTGITNVLGPPPFERV